MMRTKFLHSNIFNRNCKNKKPIMGSSSHSFSKSSLDNRPLLAWWVPKSAIGPLLPGSWSLLQFYHEQQTDEQTSFGDVPFRPKENIRYTEALCPLPSPRPLMLVFRSVDVTSLEATRRLKAFSETGWHRRLFTDSFFFRWCKETALGLLRVRYMSDLCSLDKIGMRCAP